SALMTSRYCLGSALPRWGACAARAHTKTAAKAIARKLAVTRQTTSGRRAGKARKCGVRVMPKAGLYMVSGYECAKALDQIDAAPTLTLTSRRCFQQTYTTRSAPSSGQERDNSGTRICRRRRFFGR